jgi:hypothetical protein
MDRTYLLPDQPGNKRSRPLSLRGAAPKWRSKGPAGKPFEPAFRYDERNANPFKKVHS